MAGLSEEQRTATLASLNLGYGQLSMSILLEQGEEKFNDMATAVANAATAQEMALVMTEGYNAAMENLGGVIESYTEVARRLGIMKDMPTVIQGGLH
jgi:hypothetical protein